MGHDHSHESWKHTAIYLLGDRTDEWGNRTFVFYKPDSTSRVAATYLHNLPTILANAASATALGKLDDSIPNKPATIHEILLRFERLSPGHDFSGPGALPDRMNRFGPLRDLQDRAPGFDDAMIEPEIDDHPDVRQSSLT